MKITTEDIILIENYLDGILSGNEKAAFEKRLQEEEQLSDFLRFHKKSQYLLTQAYELEKIRNFINNTSKKQKKNTLFIRLSIAASILILFGIWSFHSQIFRSPSGINKSLYSNTQSNAPEASVGQTREYLPDEKAGLFEALPSFTVNDTILLQFMQPDSIERSLVITEFTITDTVINILIQPKQEYYRIKPGLLPSGQYEWTLGDTGFRGEFIIR